VLSYNGALTELSAATGLALNIVTVVPVTAFCFCNAIAFGAGHVWVSSAGEESVTEFSSTRPQQLSERSISKSTYDFKDPDGITFDWGRIWVSNYSSNSVTEINAANGALVKVIRG
jgi:hypothetical protein